MRDTLGSPAVPLSSNKNPFEVIRGSRCQVKDRYYSVIRVLAE